MNESLTPKIISSQYFHNRNGRFYIKTFQRDSISALKVFCTNKSMNKFNLINIKCIYRNSTLFCVLALNYSIKM